MIIDRGEIETVKRPWGFFDVYANNVKSTTKILYIKPGECLSLQYHFMRDQFYLCLDDDFVIEFTGVPIDHATSDKDKEDFLMRNLLMAEANEGDMFLFQRGQVHRAQYKGKREYGRILDVAFGVNDENDIIRLRDNYGRENGYK